ncbi:glycosyl hydrolase [Talaromyces proteolyticus]|uniref:Glycosyl hydrolase n=1 Tax=Talaromyces proteolyticus TaxID=1131652 RepID=A0AAD4Q4H1_9EURO|nr:glycosyl hydrolase [Talaromyces proteolyticus]KAH8703236.1 glycosyl hydrolase [Talaromyces proteolyticus]
MRFLSILTALTSLLSLRAEAADSVDYSQYVNALMGSEGPTPGQGFGGGDIFVGGARPFGVVKFGLDSTAANWSIAVLNGGWTPDGNVTAFTMMHESGTGGEPKYGIIPQMPLTSVDAPVNILDNQTYSQPRIGNDTAGVGYFKTSLQSGVVAELSASRHAGIITYSFPKGQKHVLVDVSHVISPWISGDTNPQFYVGGEIEINDDGKSYQGYGTYIGGWNNGAAYTVYFYGEFSQNTKSAQTFTGINTDPMPRYQTLANGGIPDPIYGNKTTKATSGPMNLRVGALFSWDDGAAAQVTSRIGISFMSVQKAKGYIASEIPSWSLNDSVAESVKEWNQDVFSKIQVPVDKSANVTNLRLLYSSLYFMHLMPSDRTGENPLWESSEPFWDDFYTMWDIFRCTVSFYHVLQPAYYESMIRGLVDIYKHQGFMPDGRSGNWNGLVQGGSDADNVLADAYVKGLRGAINWTEAYAAMVKDAEVMPYNTYDPTDYTASTKEGRGALNDWLELGYVSVDRNTRCISRTVEYSLNDFSLSQVAAGIQPDDKQKYLNRSAGWQLIWDHDLTSLNFTGFLAPKYSNGSFNHSDYDPLYCGECEWSSITYEAVPWEYSFVIPHDMETLIEFMGGNSTFESRLDIMFEPGVAKQNLGANGAGITTLMNIGNEPDFMTPYLYHYINKQAKSVQQTRNLSNTYYKDAAYGIPGNSDAGAMNSWLLWQLCGLYPVVTQPVYLIGSPWFPEINMTVNGNKTLHITATGLDEGYYVQSVKVNGKQWDKNWLSHEDIFVNGGSIEFELGHDMRNWETGYVPPSPGHYKL